MARLLCFIFVFIVLNAFGQVQHYGTHYSEDQVDSFPEYPNGEQAFYQFIEQNFRLNTSIRQELGGRHNQVVFSFTVDTLGYATDIQIRNCSNVYLEREFKRILSTSPKWVPAYKEGDKTPFVLHIPFGFVLEDFQLRHTPNAAPVASTVNRKKGKKPLFKWTMICAAVAIPIIAILQFK